MGLHPNECSRGVESVTELIVSLVDVRLSLGGGGINRRGDYPELMGFVIMHVGNNGRHYCRRC